MQNDHFNRVCRSKSVKHIQMQEPTNIISSSSEDEYTFHIFVLAKTQEEHDHILKNVLQRLR